MLEFKTFDITIGFNNIYTVDQPPVSMYIYNQLEQIIKDEDDIDGDTVDISVSTRYCTHRITVDLKDICLSAKIAADFFDSVSKLRPHPSEHHTRNLTTIELINHARREGDGSIITQLLADKLEHYYNENERIKNSVLALEVDLGDAVEELQNFGEHLDAITGDFDEY